MPQSSQAASPVVRSPYLLIIRYAITLAAVAVAVRSIQGPSLTIYLFSLQDFILLMLLSTLLILCVLSSLKLRQSTIVYHAEHFPVYLLVLVFLTIAGGTWLLFDGYAFSRDEAMAAFDSDILQTGRLMARAIPGWPPYTEALIPLFRHAIPDDTFWVSNYLPGNAALRALAGVTIGEWFAGPVLATIAMFAMLGIVRRLWPDNQASHIVALTMLATSSQFLVTAMTPYAMTAHLTFNLLWLWGHLRDDRRGFVIAMVAGFAATGLHQVIFHPLFVLPFVLELIIQKRWKLATSYCAGYAVILAFWVSYWPIAFLFTGVSDVSAGTAGSGLPQILNVAMRLSSDFSLANIAFMAFNLLRLIAWQHILLVPLMFFAWPAVRSGEGIARPLVGGVALTLAAMLLLMPEQGYGWGYRYLHGYLGSLCLLAVYGWRRVCVLTERARLNTIFVAATACTVIVMIPLTMAFAFWQVRPYRTAHLMIERSGAPIVLVDATGSMTGQDLVRNSPDLSNKPIIMDIHALDARQLSALCRRYPLAVFGRREAAIAGIPARKSSDLSGERRHFAALGCTVNHPRAWAPRA